MTTAYICSIPGCQEPAERLPDGAAGFCSGHFAMASHTSRRRFLTVLRRLRLLREIWSDEARYENVIGSGRYLKLAHATCCAEEALDEAAHRLTLAVIAAKNGAASAMQLRQSA